MLAALAQAVKADLDEALEQLLAAQEAVESASREKVSLKRVPAFVCVCVYVCVCVRARVQWYLLVTNLVDAGDSTFPAKRPHAGVREHVARRLGHNENGREQTEDQRAKTAKAGLDLLAVLQARARHNIDHDHHDQRDPERDPVPDDKAGLRLQCVDCSTARSAGHSGND